MCLYTIRTLHFTDWCSCFLCRSVILCSVIFFLHRFSERMLLQCLICTNNKELDQFHQRHFDPRLGNWTNRYLASVFGSIFGFSIWLQTRHWILGFHFHCITQSQASKAKDIVGEDTLQRTRHENETLDQVSNVNTRCSGGLQVAGPRCETGDELL